MNNGSFSKSQWTEHLSHLHYSCCRRMTLLHIILSIIGTLSWATEVTTSPPVDIYWNKTNSIFSRSNNDHIIDVQIKERIKFLCPYYENSISEDGEAEHYIIYRLPKRYYDDCYIPRNVTEAQLRTEYGIDKVHNCSSPYDPSVFVSFVDTFIALPGRYGGLQYRYGKEYYFTSISTGSLTGLPNRQSAFSACRNYNMKAIVRVCCNDTFTNPPLLTGDVTHPIPVTMPPVTTTKSTTTASATPTVSWSTVRAVITSRNPNPGDSQGFVKASSPTTTAVSIVTIALCLIFHRLTLELT